MKLIQFLSAALLFATAASAVHAGPIGKGGITIKKPGHYSLIRNITVPADNPTGAAITIAASDVDLDLAGFTITVASANTGKGTGVLIAQNMQNVRIHNGHLDGLDFGIHGGDLATPTVHNVLVIDLQISNCHSVGVLIAGQSCAVEHCFITGVAGQGVGIVVNPTEGAVVAECTVIGLANNSATGIVSNVAGLLVRDCTLHDLDDGLRGSVGTKALNVLTINCQIPFTTDVTKVAGCN